jgi:hypothetical protein
METIHNEELSDLYSLPNIVRVVKSRRMRWAGHMSRMGEGRGVHRVLVGKLQDYTQCQNRSTKAQLLYI